MTTHGSARVPLVIVYALLQASIASGLDIRTALDGVGEALAGDVPATGDDTDARVLRAVAQRLAVGLSWADAWEDGGERLCDLSGALSSSWRTGSSPVLALEAAQQAERFRTRSAADAAAAELGVRLTLPLSLCLLPAFVLVGIVPLLWSIAASVAGEVGT
jgi:hypothetical protein